MPFMAEPQKSFPRHPLSYSCQLRLVWENRPESEHLEMRVTGQYLKVWPPPAPTILLYCSPHGPSPGLQS